MERDENSSLKLTSIARHRSSTSVPLAFVFTVDDGHVPLSGHSPHLGTLGALERGGHGQGGGVVEGDLAAAAIELPDRFEFELRYRQHPDAYERSFYPGVELVDAHTVRLVSGDWFEVLRAIRFLA